MTKKEFIDLVLVNDVSFQCNEKKYYILQGTNSCICGEYGNDDSTRIFDEYPDIYKNIEEMLEHWEIDGKPLKKRIRQTEFSGS